MLSIDPSTWPQIQELRAVGDDIVVVVTEDSRSVRISAERSLRASATGEQSFSARYEQLVTLDSGVEVWAQVHYPWAMEGTAQQCLHSAVRWVAQERPEGLPPLGGPG